MTHYQTLGVDQTASADEIKSAYRKLAKQHHPDLNPGDASAEAKFKDITAAFDILGDKDKRAKYDAEQQGFSANPGGAGFDFNAWRHQNRGGFNAGFGSGFRSNEDILNDILRERAAKGARGFPEYENAKNRDIQITYAITLEEAFQGKETRVKYKVGAESREVVLKIPQGIQSGVKIRHAGQGDKAISSAPPGDLFITIDIMPHTIFTRSGNDLTTVAKVDYLDAILGGTVDIPTIDGATIRLKIPQSTEPGRTMRVVGRGMATARGRGDLFVEVEVFAPDLTVEERAAIAAIKDKRKA